MSVHSNLSDTILLTVGTATGIVGLSLQEIDVILGIVLKAVSIVSFIIVAIVNLKKLFKKPNKDQ